MKIKLAAQPTIDSIVDGSGLRTVFWLQGCSHHCDQCHNPETWDIDKGFWDDTDNLVQFYLQQELQSGVTISGGDPFVQTDPLLDLLIKLKQYNVNIWVYTGFIYEQIKHYPHMQYIDVLIDGPFIYQQKSLRLVFKGSTNQRIINIPESIKMDKVVELQL